MAMATKPLRGTWTTHLRRLLSHGYFPAELPPPFVTSDFASHAISYVNSWDTKKIVSYWTTPEAYNAPRYGHARRKLSLVNPVNQLLVSEIIAYNWTTLRSRLTRSNTSEFKPQIVTAGHGRAVTGVDFDAVARRKTQILAGYGRYLKTDIARFYPSVYTHSIAWSILGKAYCKANHKTKAFKSSFANILDKAVGAGQEGQTMGIPIGPDTSRVISELIAVEIEEEIKAQLGDWDQRAIRYVDDVIVGLKDDETPGFVISKLSQGLYEYQLELNGEKTNVHGIGTAHAPEWINFIRMFIINTSTARQMEDLDSYFEHALYLADANTRDNVLLFAVKRAASFPIDPDNRKHLVRWLLYCARRSASCVSFVAEHLAATYSTKGTPKREIREFIRQQLPQKAASAHTDEVAWLLFWGREIGMKLDASLFSKIITLRSSVIGMLTLDLLGRGCISGNLDTSFWYSFANADGLRSEMWLLAYEATKKRWWKKTTSQAYISGSQYWSDILNDDVEFYDPKRRARRQVRPSFLAVSFATQSGIGATSYPR